MCAPVPWTVTVPTPVSVQTLFVVSRPPKYEAVPPSSWIGPPGAEELGSAFGMPGSEADSSRE